MPPIFGQTATKVGSPVLGKTAAETAKIDNELLQTLNSEAANEQARRSQFYPDRDGKKIFDSEREKGLGLFLEEQEKWDLIREKGLAEHRRQKKIESPVEGGPEFLADQKEKKAEAAALDKARIITLETRAHFHTKAKQQGEDKQELDELGLAQNRPRYEFRKRGKNKWVKGEGKPSGTTGGAPPVFDDFPPQPDYVPAPQPVEGFEDIPPPPMNYDSANGAPPYGGNIDSGFGDVPPPPPPPPPQDYDF